MTRTCTICRHPNRRSIEKALLSGASLRSIAGQFRTTKTSFLRHKLKHLPRSLLRAREAREAVQADNLLANVCTLHRRAETILDRAEEAEDHRTALSAIREIRGIVELLARMAGELRDGTKVSFIVSPDYQRLREAITTALAPFPEARLAVAEALRELHDVGS